MKAIKNFNYYVDGNQSTLINVGDEVPEVAVKFALNNGFLDKSSSPPLNKSKSAAPRNKTK
jgi:hypothetical protein